MQRWDHSQVEGAAPAKIAYRNAHVLAHSPIHGASFAFLLVVVAKWCVGGSTLPSEPGHWYLTISGTSVAIGWFANAIRLTLNPDFGPPLPFWYNSLWRTVIYGFPVMLAVIAALTIRGNRIWRAMFLLHALSGIQSIVHTWGVTLFRTSSWFSNEFVDSAFQRGIWSLPAVAAVVAALYDWKLARSHDVFHWIGIASLLLLIAMEWPFWLWWWQVFR